MKHEEQKQPKILTCQEWYLMLTTNDSVSAGRLEYPKISVFVDVAEKKEC